MPDCDQSHNARGLCQTHYTRWAKYGDPHQDRPLRQTNLEWLGQAIQQETDKCIDWPFGKSMGYGSVQFEGKRRRTHVVALILSGSPRPESAYCLHSCDNPSCVNPRHLRWGTHRENMADMNERGRRVGRPARFTAEEAEMVRSLHQGGLSFWKISQEMGCAPDTVRRVVERVGVYR